MAPTLDESRLRHPAEQPIFVISVLVNLALLLGAVALVAYGSDWLERYPRLAKRIDELRAAASAAVLAPFALVVLRNQRRAAIRANSVQLSRTQMPQVYADFEQMCETLGMHDVPELYVSQGELDGLSAAYSAWNTRFIVLDPKVLQHNLSEIRDVYRFFLGHEIGRVRLGHTHWLDEGLLAYLMRTPLLRNPLLHARTYSYDRYAAFLTPDPVRGLVVQASGRFMLKSVNVDEYVQRALGVRGWWPRVANLSRTSPYLAYRVQSLYDAGLLGETEAAATPAGAAVPVAAPPT